MVHNDVDQRRSQCKEIRFLMIVRAIVDDGMAWLATVLLPVRCARAGGRLTMNEREPEASCCDKRAAARRRRGIDRSSARYVGP